MLNHNKYHLLKHFAPYIGIDEPIPQVVMDKWIEIGTVEQEDLPKKEEEEKGEEPPQVDVDGEVNEVIDVKEVYDELPADIKEDKKDERIAIERVKMEY